MDNSISEQSKAGLPADTSDIEKAISEKAAHLSEYKKIPLGEIATIGGVFAQLSPALRNVAQTVTTLKDLNILKTTDKVGAFTVATHQVTNPRLVNYLSIAILTAKGSKYMTWENIVGNRALFPFNIEHVTQADAASCEKLSLERLGDDIVICLKD